MTPLEALVYATLVISSDISSIREVLDDFGNFFENGNKDSLKEMLLQIDNYVSDTPRNCVDELLEKYSWKKTAFNIRKVLE